MVVWRIGVLGHWPRSAMRGTLPGVLPKHSSAGDRQRDGKPPYRKVEFPHRNPAPQWIRWRFLSVGILRGSVVHCSALCGIWLQRTPG